MFVRFATPGGVKLRRCVGCPDALLTVIYKSAIVVDPAPIETIGAEGIPVPQGMSIDLAPGNTPAPEVYSMP